MLAARVECPMNRPPLTQVSRPLTFQIDAINERGDIAPTAISGEHPLTIYVDKQELFTGEERFT
jgi:FdhD protein